MPIAKKLKPEIADTKRNCHRYMAAPSAFKIKNPIIRKEIKRKGTHRLIVRKTVVANIAQLNKDFERNVVLCFSRKRRLEIPKSSNKFTIISYRTI